MNENKQREERKKTSKSASRSIALQREEKCKKQLSAPIKYQRQAK